MKKSNVICFAAMILACVGLALLRVTGMPGHIGISVVATIVLIIFTVLGKKDWKIPALEIVCRLAFLIAMVTGIVMIAMQIVGPISIVHKITAALFAVLLIVNFVLNIKK